MSDKLELTADNVRKTTFDCLFDKAPEDLTKAAKAEVVMATFLFDPTKLAEHKDDIANMLSQLPDIFMKGKGDGASFLMACMTKDGQQWGEHVDIDALLALGLASGQAEYCLPRKMWDALPGHMPYFRVIPT